MSEASDAAAHAAVAELMPLPLGDGRTAKKDPAYCEREGVDHCWETSKEERPPWMSSAPSIHDPEVLVCTNCGSRKVVPSRWGERR